MQFNVGFATDIGKKRQQNQDNGAAVPELGLFIVADGMGGHRGGETASAMAVEIIPKVVAEDLKKGASAKDTIAHAVRAASAAIFERALKMPQLQGMGTTTTALLFQKGVMTIGHVGDSRCYYMRPHSLWQVTRDHSLVQEKLRAGLITREQLKTDRMKNVITRSVGFEQEVNVDVYEMTVQPGDLFLICSDGLSGMLEDPQILQIVQDEHFGLKDIQKTVKVLVDQANAHGGDDNVTAVVIQVLDTGPTSH
jgi:protein phosphatase